MTTTAASKPAAPSNQPAATHAKARIPRLGRGLSSLMAHAVHVPIPQPSTAIAVNPTAAPAPHAAGSLPPVAAPVAITAPATTPTAGSTQPATVSAAVKRTPVASPPPATQQAEPVDGVRLLALDVIVPNPHQPRQKFDQAALERLAESIRSAGVMQPVIVRQSAGVHKDSKAQYELVAGERRWRAAKLAGLDCIPALVRSLSDKDVAEWALIENLQREDLNPIERAEAFRNLAEHFKLSHDQIASRVGVERSTVSNSLRLLVLHHDVQRLIRDNLLSLGQAKALAGVLDPQQQLLLAKRAIRDAWSVRRVESAVRELLQSGPNPAGGNGAGADQPIKPTARAGSHLADLEQQISRQLGTKVHLRPGRKKGSGSMTIEFYSLDQFDALLARLGVTAE